jgi:hypothetical protein
LIGEGQASRAEAEDVRFRDQPAGGERYHHH